jgi:CYTH domain-containing protein
VLRKERLSVAPFGIDLLDGPLAGVLIGEVEFHTVDEMDTYRPPADVVLREITGDPRLMCAALAGDDPVRVAEALAAVDEDRP